MYQKNTYKRIHSTKMATFMLEKVLYFSEQHTETRNIEPLPLEIRGI